MANKIFGFSMGTFAILLIVAYIEQDKIKKLLKRA